MKKELHLRISPHEASDEQLYKPIVAFNLNHAERTGEFAKIVSREKGRLKLRERNIIPNDSKLFAQADSEKAVEYYLSSDTESLKIYNLLNKTITPDFQFIALHKPYNEIFGVLGL